MRSGSLFAALAFVGGMLAYAPAAMADPVTAAVFGSAFAATLGGAVVSTVLTVVGAIAPRAIASGLISGRSAMPAASMGAGMDPIRDDAHSAVIWGRVEGDCIAPMVPDGCWWISDVTRQIRPGDYVTFAFKPELEVLPAMTKRFVGARGDCIVIETTNPPQSATAMIDTLQFCYHVEPLPALAAAIPSDWLSLPLEEQVMRIQARLRVALAS